MDTICCLLLLPCGLALYAILGIAHKLAQTYYGQRD